MFIAGPSFAVDTACSSSLLALDHALRAIRSGQCDAAVVGGTSLCLNPRIAMQFMKLGMLSPYGACKSFDASGERRLIMNRIAVSIFALHFSFYASCIDHSAKHSDQCQTHTIHTSSNLFIHEMQNLLIK